MGILGRTKLEATTFVVGGAVSPWMLVDQEPLQVDQEPLQVDQEPLEVDQEPLEVDQEPLG